MPRELAPHRLKTGISFRSMMPWLLLAAVGVLYLRTLFYGFFVLDDPVLVSGNRHLNGGLSFDQIRWAFSTVYEANWIPLTWISLMIDAQLYGVWAGGYHFTNVLLHAANALLVYFLFERATGKSLPSGLVAALFAVHPQHVESVVWISERKDVLSVFFGLLAMHAYVSYVRGPTASRLALSVSFYIASLLAKQTLVTLPFVLLLFDYWPLGRLFRWQPHAAVGRRRVLCEKIPFFFVALIFSAVAFTSQWRGDAVSPLSGTPLSIRVANAVVAYATYLRRAFWPNDLAVFYPHPGNTIAVTCLAGSLVVLLGITAVALRLRRRFPFLPTGWFWFLGTLVPLIGLVQIGSQQMADRYAYFPLIGIYVGVAWTVEELGGGTRPSRKRLLWPAMVAAVAALGALAVIQVNYWRDGVTLMRRSLAVTADNPFSRSILGNALSAEGKREEALDHFRQATELDPENAFAHYRYGCSLYELGLQDRAESELRRSLQLDDQNAWPHNALGLVLSARGKYDESRREFNRALQLRPEGVEIRANLEALEGRRKSRS